MIFYGKATKKPIEIDWFQWRGLPNCSQDLSTWVKSFGDEFYEKFEHDEKTNTIKVNTLEGTSYDVPQDYIIIRGVQGEYYPCCNKIFSETYDYELKQL
jgi:hypothetical protein